LLLVIPVLLALGVATVVVFLVALAAMFLAPLRRSAGREARNAHESPPEGGTITLGRSAYRAVPGSGRGRERNRAVTPITRALPPGR